MLHLSLRRSVVTTTPLRKFPSLPINGIKSTSRTSSIVTSSPHRGFASHQSQYYFPSESSPHEATILGFPSHNSLPTDFIHPFRNELIDVARAIAKFEPVHLYARPEEADDAQKLLDAKTSNTGSSTGSSISSNVTVIPFPVVHAWVRDTGPAYVFAKPSGNDKDQPKKRHAVSFNFNEWGNKVPPETPRLTPSEVLDNTKFAQRVVVAGSSSSSSSNSSDALIRTDLVLEGGAIELDGQGTLLFAESSVLNDNRNPSLTREEVYSRLSQLLGVTKILTIPGLKGRDVIDCHIDTVARFPAPGVAVVSVPHINSGKAWVDVADDAIQLLQSATDARGRKFRVETLEEPDPVALLAPPPGGDGGKTAREMMIDGGIATSYANYYVVNGGVIVPGYGDVKRDAAARELYESLFPGRKVVQVGIRTIGICGGGIHCVTQQVPKMVQG